MELVIPVLLCLNVAGALGSLVYVSVRLMRMVERGALLAKAQDAREFGEATGEAAKAPEVPVYQPSEGSQW